MTYTYDLNDGVGDQILEKTLTVKTLAKAVPKVEIIQSNVTQASFDFDINVTDPDAVGEITKLELIHGEDVTEIEDLETRAFADLLSDNDYTVNVTYTYDLNDGEGEQIVEKAFDFTTVAKAEPEFTFKNVVSNFYTTNGEYSVTDSDSTLLSYTVKLFRGDELVKENTEKKIEFDSLDYYTEYTIKITYTFDVNDGKGVQEKSVEQTVTTLPYIDVTSASVLDKKDAYFNGDKATIRINVENPLMAKIVSVTIDGIVYNANASSTSRIVLVDVEDVGKFDSGKIEGFTVSIDEAEYTVTDISEAKLDIIIIGSLDITSWEIVNENFERIEYATLGDKVYVVISVDKLSGNTLTSLKLTHGESYIFHWNETDPSPAFTIEYGANEIKMIDGGRFYVELKADQAKGYHFNTVSATYKNDYIESAEAVNETYHQHLFVMLNSDEVRTVSSIEELLNMENGYRYELTCNLDFSADDTWHRRGFSGVFDGKGYAIQNFLLFAGEGSGDPDGDRQDSGFFTYLDGIIENLNFESFVYTEDSTWGNFYATGIIGVATRSSIIRNCTLDENSEIVTTRTYHSVGGICGESQGLIENCTSYARVSCRAENPGMSGNTPAMGGICGSSIGIIENCVNYGRIESFFNSAWQGKSGGICGTNSLVIKNCSNYGEILAGNGICGTGNVIQNSINHGNIISTFGWVCGIGSASLIENCDNYGNITVGDGMDELGSSYGIGGETKRNCSNYGSITVTTSCEIDYDEDRIMQLFESFDENDENCYNYGAIYFNDRVIKEAEQPPKE